MRNVLSPCRGGHRGEQHLGGAALYEEALLELGDAAAV